MTNSLLLKLQEPKVFDAFVQENMKQSTYKAEWKAEMDTPIYSANKVYQAQIAEYAAAMVGSLIDKNAEKPTHTMPLASEIVGSIGRIGDEWQMDNDRLQQYYYLEGRYNDRAGTYAPGVKEAEFAKLVKFLFDPFEKAVIAPQKRIDLMYFEGLFKGSITVDSTNNTKSGVSFTCDLGVTQHGVPTVWSTTASATPVADIMKMCDIIEAKGKTVQKIRMSKKTFRKMCATNEVKNIFTLKFDKKADVATPLAIPVETMNAYLESILLPTIVIEPDRFITLANGTSTNMTADDRVVFQCADKVARLYVSDPLEAIDKLPNKSYSTYDDNLVGFWRSDRGRFVDYEMWAMPVFVGKNDYFILKDDEVEAFS